MNVSSLFPEVLTLIILSENYKNEVDIYVRKPMVYWCQKYKNFVLNRGKKNLLAVQNFPE